ncbi:MAG: hypothetical protein HY815_04845 [Candidatus Riflebacteria bacterium]|nr:hypothetical protein [Candidatus Riflebacteria bacterium]
MPRAVSAAVEAAQNAAPSIPNIDAGGNYFYHLAAKELKLDDPLVRSACRNHTVGDVSMGTTDKIVFLADFVEPTRDYPGVELLRRECALGLDRAVLLAIDMTIARLIEKQRAIDPRQLLLRNQLVRAGVRHGGWPEPVEGRAPRCPGSGTDGG